MKTLVALLFSGICFAQGTMSLSNAGVAPQGGYPAGATVVLNVTKAGNPTATGLQFDLAIPAGASSITVSAGPALPASKQVVCSMTLPAIRCLGVGFADTVSIPDGVVFKATVVLSNPEPTNPVVATLSAPIESDLSGNGLVVTVGNPTVSLSIRNGCDVDGSGSVTSADTVLVVNQAVTKASTTVTDLNSDSKTDVLDAQIASTGATAPNFVCNAH